MYTFSELDLRWIGGRKWKLLRDVHVAKDGQPYIAVARGLVTDLASIPVLVRSLLNRGTHLAAVVHDYGYLHASFPGYKKPFTRKEVDQIFKELMIASGVNTIRANLLYAGVRAGAWGTWRKYRERNS